MKAEFLKKFLSLIPAAIMVCAIFLVLFSGKEISLKTILSYTPESEIKAVIFILSLFALKGLSLVFPIIVLFLADGFLFSKPKAIVISIIGLALAISIPYFVGYVSGKGMADMLKNKYEKLNSFDKLSKKNAFFFSYMVRIIGILPCDIVSLYMGSVRIPYLSYLIGGILGFLPGLIAITFIGANITNPKSIEFIFALGLDLVIALISWIIYKKVKKNKNKVQA